LFARSVHADPGPLVLAGARWLMSELDRRVWAAVLQHPRATRLCPAMLMRWHSANWTHVGTAVPHSMWEVAAAVM